MIRNYLLVAVRNMRRQPAYSFINIAGLAVGMAAFVMITLFVRRELAFDAHYPTGDRVVQVQIKAAVSGQDIHTANSPAVMAGAFTATYPEVESATRIDDVSRVLIEVGDKRFYETNFTYADSTVFAVFGLSLKQGDPTTALTRPLTVVISDLAAARYFPGEDPVGKVVRVDQRRDFEVTGVFKDDERSAHFRPGFIASYITRSDADDPSWLNNSHYTYLLLRSAQDQESLQAKMPEAVRQFAASEVQQFLGISIDEAYAAGFQYDWFLQRLPDLYLRNQSTDQMGAASDARYVTILGLIAAFILLLACINFTNLATARAAGRAREVGVRKALGSERGPLVRQFLTEAVALSLVAMVLAFGLVLLALPVFSAVSGAPLRVGPDLLLAMTAVSLATGVLAGGYPALYLSRFRPSQVLRGTYRGGAKSGFLRSGLVVFQFTVSVVLLIGTLVVFQQLRFIQSQDVGFDRTGVVVLPIETMAAVESFPTFRQRLLQLPAVVDAASSGILPGPDHIHNNTGFRSENMPGDAIMVAGFGEMSASMIQVLGLELVAGRSFDPAFETDRDAWVVNEATARAMGLAPEEAVGTRLARLSEVGPADYRWGEIIGVTRDANFESLHRRVEPMVFGHRQTSGNVRYAAIKVTPEDLPGTLASIESLYAEWEPGFPFSYVFMDADYEAFYTQERRLGTIYTTFSLLAILIACLGLFGLSSFVTTERTKEIGVRKVLGASVPGIVVMLSGKFTTLVLTACLVAFPVAYYAMSSWLDGFAYATTLSWTVFLISALAALGIAWLTVSYQAIRAATRNPVRSLRYE